MVSLICGTENMSQMNLSTKQTHRHKEQICHCQEGGAGEGKDWECGLADTTYYI